MQRGKRTCDVMVIGGGAAGIAAAEAARQLGASVCIVERELLGGDCPHWSCVPTKALLQSAKTYAHCKNAESFGVKPGHVHFSWPDIMLRKDAVVAAVTGNDARLPQWAHHADITVLRGGAKFVDAHTVAIGSAKIMAKAFVIATGSEEWVPPVAGLADVPYLTHRSVMSLKKQPDSLVVIGGGPVGCEFATFFGLLESRVVVCEAGVHILPHEEPEVAALAGAHLRGIGVNVLESTKVLSVTRKGKRFSVTYQRGHARRHTVVVDAVLLAAGRRPAVGSLALEKTGMRLDARGVPKLDAQGRASVRHIVFAGDAAGGLQFTHVAHAQGTQAGAIAAAPRRRASSMVTVVPRVTFLDPEVASVGMTEAEAAKQGVAVRIGRCAVGVLSRAVIDGERDGMLKIILDADTDKILGAHMIGERAGEVIHELALAMHLGASFSSVASMLHAFPTYSEVIPACLFD